MTTKLTMIPARIQARVRVTSLLRRPYPQAIAVYLTVRVVGVAILAVMAAHHHMPLMDRLTAWDGRWYLDLADHGYGGITGKTDSHGQNLPNAGFAFFPLYPCFVALLSTLPGVSTAAAAITLSVLFGAPAACALLRIGRLFYPHRPVGLLLVALWAGSPMAITLSMAYTEAMFTALAAWALVGVLERRWTLAGICCVFAGLSRPTASVLIAVVAVAAAIAVYRGRDRRTALVCALLSPLGLVGYWVAVVAHTGNLGGWWAIERAGWNSEFDFGAATGKYVLTVLLSDKSVMQALTGLIVLTAVALSVLAVTNRLPWPLAAYGIGTVVLAIGTSGIPGSKVRLLLPAFTLLIPVALGLASRRPKTIVAVLVAWVLVGAWFSGNALTSWQYAI